MKRSLYDSPLSVLPRFQLKRGALFGGMIILALLSFEVFNYSTTDYSLRDLLGDLNFMGIHWATILSVAFCGIDFAGLARLFTPEQGDDEPAEVWYLFGAWLLAATMNAMLTWWGVSVAILNHVPSNNMLIDRTTIVKIVPIFVAVMVWLIRILIIGTFSVAGDRMFSQASRRATRSNSTALQPAGRPGMIRNPVAAPAGHPELGRPGASPQPVFRAAPKPISQQPGAGRAEPTYHPISMSSGRPNRDDEP